MLSFDDDEFINGAAYVYERKKKRKRKAEERAPNSGSKRNDSNPLLKFLGEFNRSVTVITLIQVKLTR